MIKDMVHIRTAFYVLLQKTDILVLRFPHSDDDKIILIREKTKIITGCGNDGNISNARDNCYSPTKCLAVVKVI
jgi:hypothetical protein